MTGQIPKNAPRFQHLIINGDDFGLTDGVCAAIVELGQAGGISSTTAMLGARDALPRIHRYWDRLSVPCGVHLHVTYGSPISTPMRQYCAKRWQGMFPRSGHDIDYPPDLLLEECRAQLDLFTREFGRPSHFDTHHCFHCDPRYREGLLKLAKDYSLPMRGGLHDQLDDARAFGVPQTRVVEDWSNTGWDDVKAGAAKLKEVFTKTNANCPGGVWELVCHPGYTDDELRGLSSLNDGRDLERQILRGPDAKALWDSLGVSLVNFKIFAIK
jgi:predicted glycoside hydrolase/deacetylase ChbG (UPF0249 family)